MTARLFTHYGQPLALDPRAFGIVMMEPPKPPEARVVDGVALVEVQGPLMHHPDPCADSYDAIKTRVLGVLAERPRAVVLAIDSPGGLVSGCFDTADEIRAACDAARVPLIAYVDGQATSAAYALACVASKVYVPPTGIVGSIGVLDAIVDGTVQDRAMGLGFTLIASGARKTDGNVHAQTTDAAIAAAQVRVDGLAALFFDHVSRRRSIAVDKVATMQAGLVHGAQAVLAGLADQVATLDQVLALVREGAEVTNAATAASQQESPVDEHETAYRASLKAIVDDEKAEAKAKAKAAAILAAMDGEPDGDEPPAKEPDGDEEPAAAAAPAAAAQAPAAPAASALAARVDRIERTAIMATRPDLSEAQRTALAKIPVESLEAALSAIPRATAHKPAAAAMVTGTRGADMGGADTARQPTAQASAMQIRMGLVKHEASVRSDGNVLILGEMVPAGKPVA